MKNRLITNLAISTLVIGLLSCQGQGEIDVKISNVNIIDIHNGEIINGQDVLISKNRIVDIRDHNQVTDGGHDTYIDATDQFLIPGLWDMHVHAVTDVDHWHALPLNIANGITGIREMFGNLSLADSLRKQGDLNGLPIPRMRVAGHILGGDPSRTGGPVATIKEGIEYVNILAEQGADFIKTYSYLKPEIYAAILKRAEALRLPVYGHPPLLLGPQKAAEMGQRSFEHLSEIPVWCTNYSDFLIQDMADNWFGTGMPLPQRKFRDTIYHGFSDVVLKEMAQVFIEQKVYFCPTLMVYELLTYDPDRSTFNDGHDQYLNPFRAWLRKDDINWSRENYRIDSIFPALSLARRKYILRKLIDHGVKIIAGTDAGITMHGFDLHRELELYVNAGMSPLEALRSATIIPAELFNAMDSLGSIEKGKIADLVILKNNPLHDISHTASIAGVIVNGSYVSEQKIDSVLSRIIHTFGQNVLDTLQVVLGQQGVPAVIDMIDILKVETSGNHYLKGLQLTTLAYQLMQEDRMDEAIILLRKEIEINPTEISFTLESLGDAYRHLGLPDSALYYYHKLLKYAGPSHLTALSKIKRIQNPSLGKPAYLSLNSSILQKYVGAYQSLDLQEIKITLKDQLMLTKDGEITHKLKCFNDSLFHIENLYPDRVEFHKEKGNTHSLRTITGRTTKMYYENAKM